jgi:APA family basic amino acid/polyamine antiporter
VLVTIPVPVSAPIDAAMPGEESRAQSMIDSARVRGGRRVTGHWEKVRPGESGRRIVDEAREIRARALVIPLPPRRSGFPVFNKTLETVLAERPCRVIIEAPPGSATRAAAA